MKKRRTQAAACLTAAAVIVSAIPSIPVSALEDSEPIYTDTRTYYFLAPENWFRTEDGALNSDIGAFWWEPEEVVEWPGVKMTAAPEIGDYVFKVDGVPSETKTIIFNSYVDAGTSPDPETPAISFQTVNINLEGYDNDCPYNFDLRTAGFDGWIYVLDRREPTYTFDYSDSLSSGAWFTLDDYKNYGDYYGTYNIEQQANDCTYYFAAPDDWFKPESGALNENIGMSVDPNDMPGYKMTPAPEVGDNVFKVTDVPYSAEYVCFNDYTEGYRRNDKGEVQCYCSDFVSTRGFASGAPYNDAVQCTSFDNMIYVLNCNDLTMPSKYSDMMSYGGEWFTLDDYRNYADYYGTYGLPDSPEYDLQRYTYYFAAPDEWFNTEKGALNKSVGVSFGMDHYEGIDEDTPEDKVFACSDIVNTEDLPEPYTLPGVEMTPAPEVGDNVFKISGLPYEITSISFNDFSNDKGSETDVRTTDFVSTRGYRDGAPYDGAKRSLTFDGMIYVLNMNKCVKNWSFDTTSYDGAWFTLDNYKDYASYYGTYGRDDSPENDPYSTYFYFLAPDDWFKTDKGAKNSDVMYVSYNDAYLKDVTGGIKMIPAPEIGDNVFKAKAVPRKNNYIRFNANADIKSGGDQVLPLNYYSTDLLTTYGHEGCIYVLNGITDFYGFALGKWFTLDDYKSDPEYYGSYGLDGSNPLDPHRKDFTIYFLAPDSWIDLNAGAYSESVAFKMTSEHGNKYINTGHGTLMMPENDIGPNVFSVTGYTEDSFTLVFNSVGQYEYNGNYKTKYSSDLYIDVDKNGSCSFDKMIYVLNPNHKDNKEYYTEGEWRTLEDYRNSTYYEDYDLETPKTFTYYFLAPDSWCDTEKGAENEDVICKYGRIYKGDEYTKMTPAPEIGRNVYKIELSKYATSIGFMSSYTYNAKYERETNFRNLYPWNMGYEGNCPYDASFKPSNLNGLIYVLDCERTQRLPSGGIYYPYGAWFKLNDYKNYSNYYGTYPFVTGISEDGTIDIASHDVDGDGSITANDAMIALRYSLGMVEDPDNTIIRLADIDADGQVSSNDALGLLRMSVA